jgi:uncharacterized protein (DUF2141 family)
MNYRILFFSSLLLLTSCARRGRPEGGPKDFDKPVMVKADPAFESLHFDTDEIKIYFDEFIKLQNVNSQLIISPPLKNIPVITPLGTPSKRITIKLTDTLQENTTYTFNFGQSVVDNTERNVLENFKYVFSTGDYIDSLEISGTIKDAFQLEMKESPSFFLYQVNENFNDSIIFNEKPMYVGSLIDSVNWEITNIKAGKYLLIALNDSNKNYKFNPKEDQIAFSSNYVTVPSDTIYNLSLFKEILEFDVPIKPVEVNKGHIMFGYQGDGRNFKVKTMSDTSSTYKSISIFDKDSDTLHYWFKNYEKDSLIFSLSNKVVFDTARVVLRSDAVDSLRLSSITRGTLDLRDTFKIKSNVPLSIIDTSKISFIDKDSLKTNYRYVISKHKDVLTFNFEKDYQNRYDILLLPGAVIDFFGIINDSLKIRFNTKKPTDYSSIFLNLRNIREYPIIIELIDSRGNVRAKTYATSEKEHQFINLPPSKYMVRITYDTNKNGKWDTGNFLTRRQPEVVYYFKNVINAKANWQVEETFRME